MPRPSRRRAPLTHPEPADIDLLDVLHALSDPTRMTIVRILRAEQERACGTFPVEVAASTLSHHFKVLREAGLIHQREEANRRLTALRGADLEARFPGLLDAILAAAATIPDLGVQSDLRPDPAAAAVAAVLADS
ncbi:helix-turn-helix domain-containing protein [Kitasatospora kazusensis]|uniref:Helix-turn-helix domain-containing protein n=1 Tax=Kitasatospora kazusensis TaxID=407974 RepID=A0ABN2ZP44_9ACTN